MFRTFTHRGGQRFDAINALSVSKRAKMALTSSQISLIEETSAISLQEKIELLLVAVGNKLTTELYMQINYSVEERNGREIAVFDGKNAIEALLSRLPFVFFQDSLIKTNRQTNVQQQFVWYQVCINPAVSHFLRDFADDLTEFEEGVLYGYPLTAIRAFAGLIDADHSKLTPASYYLAGVNSKEFLAEENEYYQIWWNRIKELSPKIVEEAEKLFSELSVGR